MTQGELNDLAAGYNARARERRADSLYLAVAITNLMRSEDPPDAYAEMVKMLDPLTDDDCRQAAIEAGLHPPEE